MTSSVRTRTADERLQRARRAVALAFIAAGFGFASLASRTPAVKSRLELDASGLGLLLLCISVGSMVSMPLTGPVVHKLGTARGVYLGTAVESTGFLLVGIGLASQSVVVSGAALFVVGLGISVWDVAMNVEGAAVERLLRRSIMARFHAGFSLGTVLGAGLGAIAAASGVAAAGQLIGTAAILAFLGGLAASQFTKAEALAANRSETSRSLLLRAWTTPRTLIVGLMVLAFAFTEGVANDWTAVAVVDGLGTNEAIGALAFGTFVTAMTLGRIAGAPVIDRWGRVAVLRTSAVVAGLGVVLVVTGPVVGVVFAGTVLWGLGAALGFPTGMSAAADHRHEAALHVSVVSAIGYTAFLAGPPLVGLLGDHVGIRDGLLVVLVALALAFVTAPAARPLREGDARSVPDTDR